LSHSTSSTDTLSGETPQRTGTFIRAAQRYGLGPLVNSADLMLHFRITYGVRLVDNTIRQWASRGHIGTYGRRRERYDIREVVAYAMRRGLLSATHSSAESPSPSQEHQHGPDS
jgi:hypothetical protein